MKNLEMSTDKEVDLLAGLVVRPLLKGAEKDRGISLANEILFQISPLVGEVQGVRVSSLANDHNSLTPTLEYRLTALIKPVSPGDWWEWSLNISPRAFFDDDFDLAGHIVHKFRNDLSALKLAEELNGIGK